MEKKVFSLDDSEDINKQDTKNNMGNKDLSKIDIKKKPLKNEASSENVLISKPVIFEEQENVEFILMDFKQPEELNKFKNMKSLSLIQQNISSLKVIIKKY